ncbi:MerR family transcriptional regulator [Streptomyces spinoverrucosus]|uniref:MerR family transcriptional regulator n=1 Tax=Streptomyces spinoverrucosus TaxID=284043 RepID=A0A4Y3VCZ9_9ACTN|nr:MerR family transcriptional regulator [Streptomyces spinoverrucosus]GEC03451.1 MerR family transcriptional regulator [Streptomyces spinoverrucosus]GHB35546.1 MerR family transcriptional regulator [Streptomyces spinoverrucosus]
MTDQRQMQIGEVAERTGLSLRTIRHYEEVGLVIPSARSKGGFRLYTETDVERLMVIRRMKPLDFSLEEMRDLLDITDRLAATDDPPAGEERERLRERLDSYRKVADARCETLRARLEMAEDFAATLRRRLQADARSGA